MACSKYRSAFSSRPWWRSRRSQAAQYVGIARRQGQCLFEQPLGRGLVVQFERVQARAR